MKHNTYLVTLVGSIGIGADFYLFQMSLGTSPRLKEPGFGRPGDIPVPTGNVLIQKMKQILN